MSKKIIKLPITKYQQWKNSLGPLCADCKISGRYLRFNKKSAVFSDGEYIAIDVMATNYDEDKPTKKICELVITREDLMDILKQISPDE